MGDNNLHNFIRQNINILNIKCEYEKLCNCKRIDKILNDIQKLINDEID